MNRRGLIMAAGLAGLSPGALLAQSRQRASGPTLSASRSVMAGSMLNVFVSRAPQGARLAIARPSDPASVAIVVEHLEARLSATLPVPGETGAYELRLTAEPEGALVILLRQPLVTTPAEATLAGPARVGRGAALPVRGIGPNGGRDRVVIVPRDAALDADGPSFFPAENIEATLEAPDEPGEYELRYVMNAPVSGARVLARRPVTVE
jgi:hypothetical protein